MEDKRKHKKNVNLEVISGDGKNLNISSVEDHIKMEKTNKKKKKENTIVIPKSKK